MDADGNYVEYMVQLYCNPNTHEMALGVFVDEECAYPMNGEKRRKKRAVQRAKRATS